MKTVTIKLEALVEIQVGGELKEEFLTALQDDNAFDDNDTHEDLMLSIKEDVLQGMGNAAEDFVDNMEPYRLANLSAEKGLDDGVAIAGYLVAGITDATDITLTVIEEGEAA